MLYALVCDNNTLGVAESIGEAYSLKQSLEKKGYNIIIQEEDTYGRPYKTISQEQTPSSGGTERSDPQ